MLKAESIIKAYTKLGSIEQLTNIVESYKKVANESRNAKLAQFTQAYSNKKGITLESVQAIINSSKSIKDAKIILESLPNKAQIRIPSKVNYANESIQQNSNELKTFAESYISKEENRRTKTYAA